MNSGNRATDRAGTREDLPRSKWRLILQSVTYVLGHHNRPLRWSTRDEKFQGAGDDLEFDRETREGFAVDLRVDGIFVEGIADQRFRFPEMDAFRLPQIAEPQTWQIAQIPKATLRRKGHEFEVVFKEIGAGGDFEGAAVVFGAADDDQRCFDHSFVGGDSKTQKIVAEKLPSALPPVRQNAEASFEIQVDAVNDHAIRARTANAQEILFLFRLFERSGQTERNFFHGAANQLFRGAGDVPRQGQFFCENVRGSAGKQRERNAVSVFLRCKTVDDFVQRAVAAAGNDKVAAFVGGALRDFGGMPRAGGFREIGFDAAAGKKAPRFIKQAPAAAAAVAGVRVVNQKSVSQSESH